MSNISHSAIARGVDQTTHFTVVPNSPGAFNESEGERLGVYQILIRSERLELLWVAEDMSVSVMEDDAGVEEL